MFSKHQIKLQIKNFFPPINWLKNYSLKFFGKDAVSGLTLAAYAIPVSLAYASLAGLPPQYGIYGYIIGGFFYALLGTGRHLAVGPTSAISMLVGVTLADLSGGDIQRWIDLASMSAFVFSGISILAYLLKLSSIINFISETVLLGFKAGAAVLIGLSQLPKLFGVKGGGESFYSRISELIHQIHQTNYAVLIFGIIAILILFFGNKLFPGKPTALIVVIASILVISFTAIGNMGFKTVGEIPGGLPKPHLPDLSFKDLAAVLPLAFACFLLAYIESVSAAKTIAQKKGYEINPRQELLALGVANLANSFGHGYPISGGLSQTAVNEKAGAETPLSLILASLTISLCMLFLTGLLKNLPLVILASIVIIAVKGLFDYKEIKRLYKVNRFDFMIALIAFISVIIFGILTGVLIGALFSLLLIIRNVSAPHVAFLGRIPGTDKYSDIKRHPDNELIPGVLIFRVESALFYFNTSFVYKTILEKIKESGKSLKIVIFDLSTSATIDSSGAGLIKHLQENLSQKGINFKVTEAHSEVRDILRKEKIEKLLGHVSRLDTLHETIIYAVGDEEPDIIKEKKKTKHLHVRDIMAQIVLGNNYFTKTHPKEYFEGFEDGQNPYITLVTCSDSRVPLNALMPDTSNKVFSVQNIGNQILSSEGSVDYGVNHLKTPVLLFLGHSDCGAIKAYLKGFDKKKFEDIKHELDFLRPVIKTEEVQNIKDIHSQVIEKNLDYQVNIAYKKYKDLVQKGELTIIAGFYDFKGEFGKVPGDIVIVNVNRIKEVNQLRELHIFKLLSKKQKDLHIGRLKNS